MQKTGTSVKGNEMEREDIDLYLVCESLIVPRQG